MSNSGLTTENLKRYLSGALDTELNLYVQQQTLIRMENTYNSLGKYTRFYKPQMKETKTVIANYMILVGVVCGIIYGIITSIIEYSNSKGGFWYFLLAIIYAVIQAVIGFVASGLTLGTVVGFVMLNKEKKANNDEYEQKLEQYNSSVEKDNRRVRNEEKQKSRLLKEINEMKRQISESRQRLNEIYGYNILFPDYRNIYAVSSIYGYLQKGRTCSLTFNEQTGDQGAYNIYEYEMRMNLIITNTQEILNRLDEISVNQYELAEGLRKANNRINSLCSSVNTHIKNTSQSLGEIQRCQSIIAYNTEQSQRQLEFMSWLHLMHY